MHPSGSAVPSTNPVGTLSPRSLSIMFLLFIIQSFLKGQTTSLLLVWNRGDESSGKQKYLRIAKAAFFHLVLDFSALGFPSCSPVLSCVGVVRV